jgi:predicted Zn-dependent protease
VRLPVINFRFVFFSVLIVLLLAGGVFGWYWWSNRPDYLFKSAVAYFQAADEARKKEDLVQARQCYESADKQLQTLLEPDKTPNDSRAWMLRWKVLEGLGRMAARDDSERSIKLLTEARICAQRAARDPSNLEAQAVVLSYFFANDDFDHAEPYARSLVDHLGSNTLDLENPEGYIAGAFFVLARAALQPRPIAHPDEALDLIRSAAEWEQKGTAAKPLPRWRSIDIEARALKIKAEQAKGSSSPGKGKVPRGPQPSASELLGQLQSRMAPWVDRVRNELQTEKPASGDKPAQPELTTLSPTDTRGLLDFLLLSIEVAPDAAAVQERADLLLQVAEQVSSVPNCPPHALRETARAVALLPALLSRLPRSQAPRLEELTKLNDRIDKFGLRAQKEGLSLDAGTYLTMARNAHAMVRDADTKKYWEQAVQLARKGLDTARARKLPPKNPVVLELNEELAWLLLLQQKTSDAEKEPLAELARHKEMLPTVHYLRGLAAVRDGRLEEGVRELLQAQTSTKFAQQVPLLIGLSYAYMGLARYDRALPVLEKLQVIYENKARFKPDDELFSQEWMPGLSAVGLEICRCHLALANQANLEPRLQQQHFQRALQYQAALRGDEMGPAADALVVNAYVAQARRLRTTQPLQADRTLEIAHKFLESIPQALRDDPRLVWAQVNLILSEQETNPLAVASAVPLSLGAGSDLGVRLAGNGQLQEGLAWQWQKAEQLLTGLAAHKDNLQAQFSWCLWLRQRGRLDEALAYLSDLETHASSPENRRQVQLVRAALMLRRGLTEDARKLIEGLEKEQADLAAEVLAISNTALVGGDKGALKERVEKALSKHEQSALLHYWQGQLQQASGNFPEAIQAYERALQFAQFRNLTEAGLLTCVLALAGSPKGGPDVAFKEADRLAAAYPSDPAVLLAYAATACQMDNIYGREGMEGALMRLQQVLAETGQSPAVGAYLAAVQWNLAGRPDWARKVLVEKALPANQHHVPSLVLALQLALADEDWQAAQAFVQTLQQLHPNLQEIPQWQAAILVGLGETAKARKIYEDYVSRYPEQHTGYLGLAALSEKAGDYRTALDWVTKWRAMNPNDLNGLRAQVRILARTG